MDSELLPETLFADPCTSTAFRVSASDPLHSCNRPYGLNACGSIIAENPSCPATWSMVRSHLLWKRIPTPFILVFNRYEKALYWATWLEQKGCTHIRIVVIDTYVMPPGKLLNAHQIATDLDFPDIRLRFHKDEYLFYGSIEREHILAVLPTNGSRTSIPVHLGTLTLPQWCFEAIESWDLDAVKAYLREENRRRCGFGDEAELRQTVLALCKDRWN